MALNRKITTSVAEYRPTIIVFEATKRMELKLAEDYRIDWSINPEQQWQSMLNSIWFYEKEDVIKREQLIPYAERFLVAEQFTPTEIKMIMSMPDHSLTTSLLGAAAVLELFPGYQTAVDRTTRRFNLVLADAKVEQNLQPKKERAAPTKTIQQSLAEQRSDLIGQIMELEDQHADIDWAKWLRAQDVAAVHCEPIIDRFYPVLEEVSSALAGDDPELVEAYRAHGKRELKRIVEWYESLLVELENWRQLKLASKKKRTKKPPNPTKLASKLKYKRYDDDLKIQSIKVEKIIDATQVWLYDTAKRKLSVYNASDLDKTLSIKGTSIVGWDPKTSQQVALRNPTEQLAAFVGAGKRAASNAWKALKGKRSAVKGRPNKETIILAVF